MKKIILLGTFLFISVIGYGQKTSIKGNVLTTLAGVPNFGIEQQLGKHFTFQFDAAASFWTIDDVPYKFIMLFPELRYYIDKSGKGFFIGGHFGGAKYKLRKWNYTHKYQEGYSVLMGGTIGYQFILNDRLNLELFLGGGHQEASYKGYYLKTGERYDGATNYNRSGEWLPYRGGIMLVYKIKNKTELQ
jgi:hypothetical protein